MLLLERVLTIVEEAPANGTPIVIYGNHTLAQGDLHRTDLDRITEDRALIVIHYSAHDFYLNSIALVAIEATPELPK